MAPKGKDEEQIDAILERLDNIETAHKQFARDIHRVDHATSFVLDGPNAEGRALHSLGIVPTASVSRTTHFSLASGVSLTQITGWDDVLWNNSGDLWDSTNDQFSPTEAGLYLVTAAIQFVETAGPPSTLSGRRGLWLVSDGSKYSAIDVPYNASADTRLTATQVILLDPYSGVGATYVQCKAYQDSGTAVDVACHQFSIVKVADYSQIGSLTA